ncbi:MAG: PD-(D/E)XK nuclease family protein [Candidatus Devosia phytovorans]|uniref:PD-(D/E)XK nuclease family protein n=1 Tax=Candidatus Devosia phytovorans TaxID=3121372 RepID=A0AAJ6AYT9_9HYPH|nr:PD-(D/E)XK nuclease family protein [Devosia sp.]WEK03277.1 MAG: PD-(D/E)XK nuclease family protein [Devosia sp.]
MKHDDLEELFVNNQDLHRLGTYLNRFNPIKTMRMQSMEIRHSAILAWLLDPRETHGLEDKFLRAFLSEAMRGQSHLGSPSALEISQADLRDAEVRREWQNIDIFVLLPRLKWAFIIENKFNSTQHEGQLSKYAERVKSIFEPQEGILKVRGVFLTLHDEEPADDGYVPILYASICEILPDVLEANSETLRTDVAMFVGHYLEVIREATGMSSERDEMEALARQLYRSHRKVLDFIMEHGARTDFILAVESVFGEQLTYHNEFQVGDQWFVYSYHNHFQASFLPKLWVDGFDQELTWEGCDGWWAEYPLICWFQLNEDMDAGSGSLSLIAEVGPAAPFEFRSALVASIRDAAAQNHPKLVGFQKGAANEGKKFSKFLRSNDIHIADIQNAEEIDRAMRALLVKFKGVFEMVGELLPQFRKYGVVPNTR